MHFASIQCSKMQPLPGLHPDPAGGAYSTLPHSTAGFKRSGEGEGMKGEGRGREGRRRREKGREGKLEQGRRLAKAGPDDRFCDMFINNDSSSNINNTTYGTVQCTGPVVCIHCEVLSCTMCVCTMYVI